MSRRIFIAGHRGMVGSAIHRLLRQDSGIELVTRDRSELDLTSQAAVQAFFHAEKLDEVYLCAARVGGIHANNTYPADFLYENIMLESNVIHSAWQSGVQKLLFLGSSCIYPRLAQQPMKESELLQGPLEPTNEPYALAKIAGIKLCESFNRQHRTDYRSVMPANLYGPGDNYHQQNSHVIPALLRRFHEAKLADADAVTVWGSGKAKREFLYVDDMAAACKLVMDLPLDAYQQITEPRMSHVNVGTGVDCSIAELVEVVREVTGFSGRIEFDTSKPDGAPRKLLDIQTLSGLGWAPTITLRDGLARAYDWFVENSKEVQE